jgi:ubiquinone/menaquinone biosynthesis C-methylase UbiE
MAESEPLDARVVRANQDFHDRFADHYESYYRNVVFFEANQDRVRDNLEQLRTESPGGTLVDVGCGTGNIARLAADLFPTRYGVDISAESLKRAEPHYTEVIQGDVCDLRRFEDASVDAVTGYSLLHHLYDPKLLFRECARILKPGGCVYFDNDPNSAYFVFALSSYVPERVTDWVENMSRAQNPNAANQVIGDDPETYKLSEFHHHFGGRFEGFFPRQIRRWLADAGFDIVAQRLFQIGRRQQTVSQVPCSFLAQFRHSQMCVIAKRLA